MRKLVIKLIKFLVKKYSITGTEINTVEIKHAVHYAQPIKLQAWHELTQAETHYMSEEVMRACIDGTVSRLKQEIAHKAKEAMKVEEFYDHNTGETRIKASLYLYDQNQ